MTCSPGRPVRAAGLAGLRVLDIGCGGGFLAEEFAALGCQVTGVDPSPASIGAARAHAAGRGLRIDYRVGAGEELPVAGRRLRRGLLL